MQTGGAVAGTVFRVTNGEGESSVSPEWRGRVKTLAPPSVAGGIAANEFVSPIPGLWSGGWQGEGAEMQLAACVTEAGEQCVSITSPHFIRQGCAFSASFSIDPRFAGMYLRVADRQSGGPHLEAGYAVFSPSGENWGQITAATNPPTGECGPPPPATATISAAGVARVECAGGCEVELKGTREGQSQLLTRRIPTQTLLSPGPALEVSLPRESLARLGAGKVRLTVDVDGMSAARRTVVSSAP
jgi:hypothetical protein